MTDAERKALVERLRQFNIDSTDDYDLPAEAADQIEADAARIAALEAQLAEREHPQNHWTTKGAINAARKLIEVADALCFSAETACGTAGRDEHLCNAIEQWVAERDRQRQILRIIELEGHSPEIGAGILHPEARAMQGARDD